MAGLPPDRIRRAPCSGREGQEKRGSRGQSCLNSVQRWRKGSCVYDLSTSFQRGKERTIPRVFPSSVRPTDKPSFFCNFRARSPGNPWKIRDPTETVLLSRRVTTRVSGFVVLLSLLQRLTARRSPSSSRGREQNCDRVTCHFGRLEEISVEFIRLAPPPSFRSFRIAILRLVARISPLYFTRWRGSQGIAFFLSFLSPTDSR